MTTTKTTTTPEQIAAAKLAREQQKTAKNAAEKAIRATATLAVLARWEAIPTVAPCACGCDEPVPVRRFRPGHDAKLKSRMLTEEIAKATGAAERTTVTTAPARETKTTPRRAPRKGGKLAASAQA